jgi:hypothetical protein
VILGALAGGEREDVFAHDLQHAIAQRTARVVGLRLSEGVP